ncbi:hypothetical protein KAR91_32115 [Candidatus Pacearchaeota archaeon]|nr:hypothetical protein [Candidatus Pacearchaeota archaeon]
MSSTANHKKMFHILRESKKHKGLLLAVMFQIMEDDPAKVANAYDKVVERDVDSLIKVPFPFHSGFAYKCKDCHETVDRIGIAGACIKCDPQGFDPPY